MKFKLTAIVLLYHNESYFENCITTLMRAAKLANVSLKIIIVINEKKTNLQKTIKLKKTIIIQNMKNLGFGRSYNQAIKKAYSEWVLFLNLDTITKEDALKRLITHTKRYNVGIIAPKILHPDNTLEFSIIDKPNFWNIFKEQSYLYKIFPSIFYSHQVNRTIYEYMHEVEIVSGVYLLVKKKIFEKIGGFDERFFIYFEDIDLCERIRKIGCKIIFEPQAEIIHYGHQSNNGIVDGKRYVESLFKYLKKNNPKFIVKLGLLSVILGSLVRLIYWSIRFPIYMGKNKTSEVEKNLKKLLYLKGIIKRGYKLIWK